MKKTHLISAISIAMALSSNVNASDAYTESFANYAKEIQKYQSNESWDASIRAYEKEVAQVQKSAGYIGKALPLPEPIKVADGVYTVVGSLIWHNPSNFGLNNNLSFIIFEDGVFVFNGGANPAIAYSFHQQIKKITDKPVKWLAVENSQGHAYLGASYWVDQGVKHLYSHSVANNDFHNAFARIKQSWGTRVGHELTEGARDVSDLFTTFDDKLTVNVGGGEQVEILNFGPGHTPGSTIVYLPKRKIVLPGDLAYNQRMLALFSYTDTLKWTQTFEAFMSAMPKDVTVIPGHGAPATLQKVKEDTYDYLKYMQNQVQQIVDAGGSEADAQKIDQSMYKHRSVYEQTYRNNAVHIYREITGGDLGESNE
ncbi:MBL fold metallo-hydrolase [Thiomicrorhabdus sp. ZW0627]|uniref:MBL fold metallo-hydrolase n=1 Tax=Thiomicrorhabdus sp. ZW0627 TaxID=3039774 RepID=UPI00243699FD|nr:MBL fold metallo-hydrolase [Thiomicrorhabdus sp. ZW0627]MDG6773412.1 MBL fold metallo-hydrolase [Thiomicrorhabdus sp. ZW0627]